MLRNGARTRMDFPVLPEDLVDAVLAGTAPSQPSQGPVHAVPRLVP